MLDEVRKLESPRPKNTATTAAGPHCRPHHPLAESACTYPYRRVNTQKKKQGKKFDHCDVMCKTSMMDAQVCSCPMQAGLFDIAVSTCALAAISLENLRQAEEYKKKYVLKRTGKDTKVVGTRFVVLLVWRESGESIALGWSSLCTGCHHRSCRVDVTCTQMVQTVRTETKHRQLKKSSHNTQSTLRGHSFKLNTKVPNR